MTILNRILGLLVGLVLLTGGLLLMAEAVLAYLGRRPWLAPSDEWAPAFSELSWQDPAVIVAAVLSVLVGLGILVLQLWPQRPAALRVVEDRANRLAALDGRGVQELLRRAAVDDDDVLHARVRLSRRTAKVSSRVPQDAPLRAVQSRSRMRVRARVDELQLQRPLRVKVRARRSKARVR